jgi:hypothetical protein
MQLQPGKVENLTKLKTFCCDYTLIDWLVSLSERNVMFDRDLLTNHVLVEISN